MAENDSGSSLKLTTARTLKWNTIDRFGSQVLYALTGIVLANLLPIEDFGIVNALLVFQAFAILFVDSGFGAALLQRKEPSQADYSTVFWFNLFVSLTVYLILFFAAPLIADIFDHTEEMIPLSRVMFLTFILNGLAIVQTNRLMKQMNVRMIAVSNLVGLIISGIVGIVLALKGCGAWALVWQTLSLAFIKTVILWLTGNWLPSAIFSRESMSHIWRVGLSVFSSSALNTLCQNLYTFIIGAFYSLRSLGIYGQADKWSKMGSASISQILTASFVPLLSKVQNDGATFRRYVSKINRFTAFILFPVMLGLAVSGSPLFHALFGTKWDAAIPLFQILMLRGIFIVLISLYSNYLLSLGYAKKLFIVEFIKDLLIIVAILSTVWFDSLAITVWGQFISSLITYVIVLVIVSRATSISKRSMLLELLPSATFASIASIGALISGGLCATFLHPTIDIRLCGLMEMTVIIVSGLILYIVLAWIFHLPELPEALSYLLGRFRRAKAR